MTCMLQYQTLPHGLIKCAYSNKLTAYIKCFFSILQIMLTILCILNNEHNLDTIFLLELEICKIWLHYSPASIDKFSKGAVNTKSLGTTAIQHYFFGLSYRSMVPFNI